MKVELLSTQANLRLSKDQGKSLKKSEIETAHGENISEKGKSKHFMAKCQFLNLNHFSESFIQ